jgi:hypothetical protein
MGKENFAEISVNTFTLIEEVLGEIFHVSFPGRVAKYDGWELC